MVLTTPCCTTPNEPQHQPHTTSQPVDFTTILIIKSVNTRTPIFYVEVKPSGCLSAFGERRDADIWMRDYVREFVADLRILKLHGVSAMGYGWHFIITILRRKSSNLR